jgi:hypothetical protein
MIQNSEASMSAEDPTLHNINTIIDITDQLQEEDYACKKLRKLRKKDPMIETIPT